MATINGAIITDFGSYEHGDWVFTQADGKIVVLGITAGFSGDDMAIARYNSNGSLDSTFDGDGKLITTSVMSINAVRLLSDGKFLTVGSSGGDFAVARYNSDGSLDKTFDVDGKQITNVGGSDDEAWNVTVQADNKLLVVGYYGRYGENFGAVRYNNDGSLDTSFDGNGVFDDYYGLSGWATCAAIQPDGKTVIAGNYWYESGQVFGIIRLNRDGTYDEGFGGDGTVGTILGGKCYVYTVKILNNGKILAAGTNDGNFALVRYNINGSLDTTFSSDGIVTTDLGLGGTEDINNIVMLADGKFLAA